MGQCFPLDLDVSFAALSNTTRRGILERLGRSDASVSALADGFHMSLTGMKKHIGVLELARLVTTQKSGGVRTCRLDTRGLDGKLDPVRPSCGGRLFHSHRSREGI